VVGKNLKGRIDRLSDQMIPNEDNPEELETWAKLFAGKANKGAPTQRGLNLARDFIAWCHPRGDGPGLDWLIIWAKS